MQLHYLCLFILCSGTVIASALGASVVERNAVQSPISNKNDASATADLEVSVESADVDQANDQDQMEKMSEHKSDVSSVKSPADNQFKAESAAVAEAAAESGSDTSSSAANPTLVINPTSGTNPTPEKPTRKKFTEVIGGFISDLLKIPVLFLSAISNAIASITGSKVPTTATTVTVGETNLAATNAHRLKN